VDPPGRFPRSLRNARSSNAYMLVYVRKSDLPQIMCNVRDDDIAEHLRRRLGKEAEEKERKRKEKADAHMYTVVQIAEDADIARHVGPPHNQVFDLVKHDVVPTQFRLLHNTPFSEVRDHMAKHTGYNPLDQRYWKWAGRQNRTFRPCSELPPDDDEQVTVHSLRDHAQNMTPKNEVKLFMELPDPRIRNMDKMPGMDKFSPTGKILLFFKFYDPHKEQLTYVGHASVARTSTPRDLAPLMRALLQEPPESRVDFLSYEEIKFDPVMCEVIHPNEVLEAVQIEDGDIICFQVSNPSAANPPRGQHALRFPKVDGFLTYLMNRQFVRIRPLDGKQAAAESGEVAEFSLELGKEMSYQQFTSRIAEAVKAPNYQYVRIYQHSHYSNMARAHPVNFEGVATLQEVLVQGNQAVDLLYYEILDIPLPELEKLKTVTISFADPSTKVVGVQSIRVARQSCVREVLEQVKQIPEVATAMGGRDSAGATAESGGGNLRLLQIFGSKIYKVIPGNEMIDSINDQYWTLRAEEVVPHEEPQSLTDQVVHFCHFSRPAGTEAEQNREIPLFGEPFFLAVAANETISSVKQRVQAKLRLSAEEFAKLNFFLIVPNKMEELVDDEILVTKLAIKDSSSMWDNYIGIEHKDRPQRRAAPRASNNYEKAVSIKG